LVLGSSEELSYFTRSGPAARTVDGPPKWIPFGGKIQRAKELTEVKVTTKQQSVEKKVSVGLGVFFCFVY
jgi:hypothetical protein